MANIPNQEAYSADSLMAAEQAATSDMSARGLLEQIFGTIAVDPLAALMGGGGAAAGDIFGTIFMFINMGLLTLGGIYLSYKGLAAVTQTAHDGEFMGKQFNSVWVPIRITTGIFWLLPIAGGWSALQVLMLWFGIMGAGLGNMAWQGVVGQGFKPFQSTMLEPPVSGSSDKEFVVEALKMNVCVAARNTEELASGSGLVYSRTEAPLLPGVGRSYRYGVNGNAECGEISFADISRGAAAGYAGVNSSLWGATEVNALGVTLLSQKIAIDRAVQSAFINLDSTLATHAKSYIGDNSSGLSGMIYNPDSTNSIASPPDAATMRSIRVAYQNSITDAIAGSMRSSNALDANNQAMLIHARQDGFTTAGAWYMTMAQSSYAINSLAANIAPSIISVASTPLPSQSVWSRAYAQTILSNSAVNNGVINGSGNSGNQDAAWKMIMGQMDQSTYGGQGIVNWIINEGSGEPVMIRIKNMADRLVTLSGLVMSATGLVKGSIEAAKESASTVPIIGGLVKAGAAALSGPLKPWLDMLSFACMLAFGFFLTCSIFLPMIPFIVFMGQVLGWLINVVEGVAAAPFLAFAHFDTDGEGLGHKTQYGYIFMLQSFMRPVMLVLGFVFACMLIETIGGYVLQIFPMAMANAQMDSITGFFSILGFTAMFFLIMVGLINACMSVTYLLPDAIFAFIGVHNSAATQVGRDQDKVLQGSTIAASGIGNKGGGAATQRLFSTRQAMPIGGGVQPAGGKGAG